MYNCKDRMIFRHEPICFNGKPIINNCKWNFKLIADNLMQNTESLITLEYNEETEKDFVPLFSLNLYTKVPYNQHNIAGIPREEIFIEGKDVQIESPTLMTFVYIPSKYLYDEKLHLFKNILSAYEASEYHSKKADEYMNNYNKLKDKYSELTGMTYEEIDEKVKSTNCKNNKDTEDNEN